MSVALAALVVVAFALALERMEIPDRAREVGDRARESLRVIRHPELDDRSKERALRRQAIRLFGLVGVLVGGSLLALGLPLLGVCLLEMAGVASFEGVLSVLGRPDFLVGATLLGTGAYLAAQGLR